MHSYIALFWPDPGPARLIGWIIVVAFLAAVAILATRFVRTHVEAGHVPAENDRPATAMTVPGGKLSTTQFRLASLSEYRGRSEAVDANEAAAALQERAFDADQAWVRYLVAVLLFLGLMGTVVGLATTIGNLRPILDSAHVRNMGDVDNIVHAIGTVIGAMRNAFACTLLGVLSSVLCSLGAQAAESQYHRSVLQPLDEYCSRRLVPYLSRSPEYEQFSQAARELAATVERSAEVVRTQQMLQDSFGKRVTALAELLEKAGATAGGHLTGAGASVGQHLAQASRLLAKDLASGGGAVSEKLGASSLTAAAALDKAGAGLGAQMDRTTRWLASVGPTLEGALRGLAESESQMSATVSDIQASIVSLKDQLAHVEGLSGQSLDGLRQVHQKGEDYAKASADRMAVLFGDHLKRVEAAAQAGEAQMRDLGAMMADFSGRQGELIEAIRQYGQQSQGVLGTMVKSQEEHEGMIQQIAQRQLDALERQTKDAGETVRALRSLVESAEYAFRDAISTVRVAVPGREGATAPRPNGAEARSRSEHDGTPGGAR